MSLTEELLSKDILIFMPILFIIIMAIFRIFKSTKIIIISWVIMLLAVALAYSLVSFLGIKLTPLVLLVPIFALGLLSDYIIHYIYHFLFSPITGNNLNTRRSLIFPLGLTALSTLTGFFSLIYIGLSGHVLLGSIIGIAVIITFIGVFLWLPYLSFPKISIEILPKFSYYQVKFFDFLYRSRKPLFLLLTITVIWGITTLPNLRIEPYPIEQLPQDSTVKMAENILNSDFYGALPFFIEIDSGEVNGFLRKKTLLAVDKITSHLNESKEIGFNYSLLSVLKQINSYFNGNENSIFDYKDEFGFYQMLIEQYLIYYSSSVDPLEYESLVDPSFRYFSIKGYVKYTSVDSLNSFYDTIEEIKKELPQDWSLSVHGVIDELKKDKKSLQKNWIFSFGIGNFLIFITVLIFYRKFRLALFSLIPGFISMIISFGIISLLGIKIDSFSIIFVAIITGLVIDYSIHTLSAIDKIHEVASIKEGFTYINNYSGIPIFLSFLTSLFSFSVLFLSSFSGARSLGILLSISLLVSYILSFYLLPIIILPTKIKKEH
ncbi:MAG: hypothetical protein B6229_03905 [Spirochaetaceae bacterium 4572_7]|nr:MAG: hypothetical protein B6229_03905 [Spirochaetaceae bacterium 4572_7]